MKAAALLAALLSTLPASASAQSLVERLGYPADSRALILHADDLGEWHAVNAGFQRLHELRRVTSGVAMVPCPWFPEIAAWALAHPDFDLGLHLTVTSERTDSRWGPVSREPVPSLLDAQGYFRRIQAEAAQVVDPRDVEVELRAQVERALAFGLKPTHLDSHQAVLYQREDLFRALARVSREVGIPLGLARNHLVDHSFMAEALGPDAPLIDRSFDIPPDVPVERWGDWYEEQIRAIGPGVTAIVFHPGLADAELRAATRDRPTWGAEWRQRDVDFFSSDRFGRLLEEGGFRLTTWREVAAVASGASVFGRSVPGALAAELGSTARRPARTIREEPRKETRQ